MIKLLAFKRGNRSHYNKTDVIVQDDHVIGEVEFAYGRECTDEKWYVWEYVIRLPLKNLYVKIIPKLWKQTTYTICKGQAIENITRLLSDAESESNCSFEQVSWGYAPYGTCVQVMGRLDTSQAFKTWSEEYHFKTYPHLSLHQAYLTYSAMKDLLPHAYLEKIE